jgi:hypothetical protein
VRRHNILFFSKVTVSKHRLGSPEPALTHAVDNAAKWRTDTGRHRSSFRIIGFGS